MVQVVKKEWHQVTSEFKLDFDQDLLSEIYPDKSEEEIEQFLKDLESGDILIEDVILDASDNDVALEWDHHYDDWWTDRKGGYDITYDIDSDTNFVERD
jgi:hypothetical protein